MIYEQEIAIKAAHQFARTIELIKPEQWDQTLPPTFKTMDGKPVTVRESVNYHAYDDAWIPDMLAGKTMQEVGEDKWKGDLLTDDPKLHYIEFNDDACIAIEKLDDPERRVHTSFGDFTARDYLLQVLSFRGLRAYDFAKALGFDTKLPDDLVEGMWKLLTPVADEWRTYGVYGPAIDVPESAPLQQRMLGVLGYE